MYGFGETAIGGVGVAILRIPSPSQIYFPTIDKFQDIKVKQLLFNDQDSQLPATKRLLTKDIR